MERNGRVEFEQRAGTDGLEFIAQSSKVTMSTDPEGVLFNRVLLLILEFGNVAM